MMFTLLKSDQQYEEILIEHVNPVNVCKLCGHYLVIILNRTPISDWCVRLVKDQRTNTIKAHVKRECTMSSTIC
jgi:ssDNA-binding Zn-finger/Zn-ribbon topoisomerase 1